MSGNSLRIQDIPTDIIHSQLRKTENMYLNAVMSRKDTTEELEYSIQTVKKDTKMKATALI